MAMNNRLMRPRASSKFAAIRKDLVAYWPLNEDATSGDVTAEDWTGRGNNLTSTNSVLSIAGKTGNGRSFVAGNSEYLDSADRADLRFMDGRSWTIALWFYVPTSWPGSEQNLFSRDAVTPSSSREISLELRTAGPERRVFLEVNPGNALTGLTAFVSDVDGVTGNRLPVNTWHFVAFTYNASTRGLAARLNAGTQSGQSATNTIGAGTLNSGTGRFTLGRRPFLAAPDQYLTGYLDEIAKWDRVLSSSELDTLWNGGAGIDLRK